LLGPALRQIFLSHSKDDSRLRFFERACASAGVALRTMELEHVAPPPWRSIFAEIASSQILFVSLSEPLVQQGYRHTQNWIDYEVGLACGREMPIWVFEPYEVRIDFTVPYCTHSVRLSHDSDENVRWLKTELEQLKRVGPGRYSLRQSPKERYDGNRAVTCVNERCGLVFYQLNRQGEFFCPSCRTSMRWEPPQPSEEQSGLTFR
jgi:hypothetical protein